MVDRNLADELAGNADYTVRKVRGVKVRGYRRLEPWALRRAGD